MNQESITLFITEAGADRAAIERLGTWGKAHGYSWNVIPATMRDHDGSVDHGFKVSIMDSGHHQFFL